MKALAVLHDYCSAPGLIGDALRAEGWELDTVTIVGAAQFEEPNVDFDFPDVQPYDLIVPFGAPWSVYDVDTIGAWVQPELDWLSTAMATDTPVLGVCFGGQLLARALGGTVVRGETPEVGWHEVTSDREDLVPSGPWFQWHYDRFTVPPGATSVARNSNTEQAFVHGRSLGLQFHPELTTDILQGWLSMGGDDKAQALGIDPADLRDATTRRHDESATRTRALVAGYLSSIF